MPATTDDTLNVALQNNVAYYNEIAPLYDSLLEKEASNVLIRKLVVNTFISTINKGWVLDFGGGTGQDIDWLIANGYKIFFCEPSVQMRKLAFEKVKEKDLPLIFVEDTDFNNWLTQPPFTIQLEAVLMNFAVLNCIVNIDVLFNTLATLIRKGGSIIALLLNNNETKLLRNHTSSFLKNKVFRSPVTYTIQQYNKKQTIYLHTKREIEKAAKPHFFVSYKPVTINNEFIIAILTKR